MTEGTAGEQSSSISKGIPLGRAPTVELRNMHSTYAITWCVSCHTHLYKNIVLTRLARFSLSAATTVMLFTLMRKPSSTSTSKEAFRRAAQNSSI